MKGYIIDLDTLEIKKKKLDIKKLVTSSFPYIFLSFVISVLSTAYLITSYTTPKEAKLLESKQVFIHKYDQLNSQINQLDKQLNTLAQKDDKVYRNVFGLPQIPQTWRYAGIGGSIDKDLNASRITKQTETKLKLLAKKTYIQQNSYKELIEVISNKELMASSIPAIRPLARKDIIRFSSPFGYRMHPILHVIKFHTGIDLTARIGTPVYATGDGLIVRADYSSGGYGNIVVISHGFGYESYYAHLSKILVKPGQKVKRGDLIGLVGTTGRSTGPHLHYEIRINGKPVNPVNFYYNDITDQEYSLMVKQAKSSDDTHLDLD